MRNQIEVTNQSAVNSQQSTVAFAMYICHVSKKFPKDELYSVATQIRKFSRSVCSNAGEGYHKPLYEAHFVSKISDSNDDYLITFPINRD